MKYRFKHRDGNFWFINEFAPWAGINSAIFDESIKKDLRRILFKE